MENFQRYRKTPHCTYVLVSHKFRHSPIVRQASRARKLSGAALPYPLGTYFRRYSEKASMARLAQFIPGSLCVSACCEFDFGPKVQFSCLQSRPCLPMTCRCDVGIFSINNARDLKLPKRRRAGTRRAIRINRSTGVSFGLQKKNFHLFSLPTPYRLL